MHLDHLKNNIENQRYNMGDDPLNLDGSIELPQFTQHHVRIRDGEFIEKSRRRLDDLSEDELSSIPSYANLEAETRNGRVPMIQGMSQIPDDRTLAEDGQMIFDENDADIDMKDLDIGDD
jgi:hypothetical protein